MAKEEKFALEDSDHVGNNYHYFIKSFSKSRCFRW